jgi:hypothetical protein
MRLIIAGSRGITSEADYQILRAAVMAGSKPDEIVSGGAKGPDLMGERIAAEFGIPVRQFIPEWERPDGSQNKGAGFIRNGNMAVYASDTPSGKLVAFWDGQSRGTQQMIEVAHNYHLEVVVLSPAAGLIPLQNLPVEPFIFKQSHSSLGVFETCPRQYYAKYISKEVKYVQRPGAKWGDDAHIALEQFVITKGAARLPSNMAHYEQFGTMVLNRAVTKDLVSTPYSNRAGWLGGKIDITILYRAARRAEVFDWKSGKVKNDVTQLKLYGGFTFADYPEIDTVGSAYIWLEEKVKPVGPPLILQRADLGGVWGIFQHKYDQLKDAYVRGAWPEKPNGLCKAYCDVVACPFHGKGRH